MSLFDYEYVYFENSDNLFQTKKMTVHKEKIEEGRKYIAHQYTKYIDNNLQYFFIDLKNYVPEVRKILLDELVKKFTLILFLEDFSPHQVRAKIDELVILPKIENDTIISSNIQDAKIKYETNMKDGKRKATMKKKTSKASENNSELEEIHNKESNFDEEKIKNLKLYYHKKDNKIVSFEENLYMHRTYETSTCYVISLCTDFSYKIMSTIQLPGNGQEYYNCSLVRPSQIYLWQK